MNLNEYLFYEKISKRQFAKTLELSHHYIGQITRGQKMPSKKVRRHIAKATEGKVPEDYWESEEYKKFMIDHKLEYKGNSHGNS